MEMRWDSVKGETTKGEVKMHLFFLSIDSVKTYVDPS